MLNNSAKIVHYKEPSMENLKKKILWGEEPNFDQSFFWNRHSAMVTKTSDTSLTDFVLTYCFHIQDELSSDKLFFLDVSFRPCVSVRID